jgi:hypothetical protein
MLYDTPQTDHVEKMDRNAEIIARYEAGETGVRIAQAYGISERRYPTQAADTRCLADSS